MQNGIEDLAHEIRLLRYKCPPPLMTLNEAAQVLAVSERTVERYIEHEWLPQVSLPSGTANRDLRRIDPRDLDQFIKMRKGKGSPSEANSRNTVSTSSRSSKAEKTFRIPKAI